MGNRRCNSGCGRMGLVAYISSNDNSVQSVCPIESCTSAVECSRDSSYIQMSGMVLGGMVEADWRLRQYEYQMRMQRRWQKEKAKWDRYEEEFIKENHTK